MRAPLVTAAAGASAVLALHLRDPHAQGSWGLCPFSYLVGLQCPGCGGLRAVNDLTHLQVGAAVSSNVLAVVFAVVMVLAWTRWAVVRWRGGDAALLSIGPRAAVAIGVVLVVFTVVRNTPWGAWLAP
ncbi:MAG: DUF2752 domain-containing protein [Nocardioidaceae bacterium]|nr:DUF2752 domain-containing protein [Nocardioidaceae bacterium]